MGCDVPGREFHTLEREKTREKEEKSVLKNNKPSGGERQSSIHIYAHPNTKRGAARRSQKRRPERAAPRLR